jgi:methylenetetrahydrofolate reductase (NADPH)
VTRSPRLVAASLEDARFEIIPMRGIEAELEHLPPGAVVTITASPSRGLEPTLDLAERVAGRGHHAVPHLSARLVRSAAHLDEILVRMVELHLPEVFVIAGDVGEPAGPYEGAADLLEAMAESGHEFDQVGISGYPESHPVISDPTTIDAMHRKAPHATYIVSQICFDVPTTRRWIAAVRDRGITLPIHVGLPGVVDRSRLLRLSLRVGIGDSARFLSHQSRLSGRLLTGYQPDELVHGLTDLVADPVRGVAGWHLFTFNEVERTEAWRQRLLATTLGAAL